MAINRIVVSGNLTRDGQLKRMQSGMPVLEFGMAVNDRRKNPQTGEWEDVPNFVDVSLFGKRAESLATYFTKGTKVAVDGRLRYSTWERDGQKRSKHDIVADEIEFMSSRDRGQQGGYGKPEYVQSTVIDGNQGSIYDDIPW